ncbi:MAG: T9SS type A sorting domain-containing protein [Bacteroidota bacterium]
MRRIITTIFLLSLMGAGLFAQQTLRQAPVNVTNDEAVARKVEAINSVAAVNDNANRLVTCGVDVVDYGLSKLSGGTFSLWTISNGGQISAAYQYFPVPTGATVNVSQVDFLARYLPSGTSASFDVNVQLFGVNANLNPTGAALATASVTIDTSSSSQFFTATFAAPVALTQDFAVVVENPSDSSLQMGTNFATAGDGLGDYYAGLRFGTTAADWTNGSSINIGGGLDFNVDFFFGPYVTYDFDASFVADASCLLQGETTKFTSTSDQILSNRVYNRLAAASFFDPTRPDSTFGWDTNGDSNLDIYGSEVDALIGPNTGMVDVTLEALMLGYTQNGICLDTETSMFTSGPAANAVFDSALVSPKTYQFDGLPASFNDTYSWDFGDGTTDNTNSPSVQHTYAISDNFTVTLITSSCGDNDTTTLDIFVAPDFAAGINTLSKREMNVYPNPVQDILNVELELDNVEAVTVEVFDMLGKLVSAKNLGNVQVGEFNLDMANFESGIYFVKVTAGDRVKTDRVFKN